MSVESALIFLILLLGLATSLVVFFKPKNNIEKRFNQILLIVKNRKSDNNKLKNAYQNHERANIFKKDEINFRRLKKFHLTKKLKKLFLEKKNITYVEMMTKKHYKPLASLSKKVELIINNNEIRYRAFLNKTIVERLAEFFASEIAVNESYNVYENFERLTKIFKVYKKEAEILSSLIAGELIKKYIELYRAIKNIKARVLRGARVKRLSSFSDKALVYGAYILSPIRTKLFDKNSDKIISATNFVLRELDETYKKQVIILNYIKFLTKNN